MKYRSQCVGYRKITNWVIIALECQSPCIEEFSLIDICCQNFLRDDIWLRMRSGEHVPRHGQC